MRQATVEKTQGGSLRSVRESAESSALAAFPVYKQSRKFLWRHTELSMRLRMGTHTLAGSLVIATTITPCLEGRQKDGEA